MTDAEHAESIQAARVALNDALYAAWKDGLKLTVDVVRAPTREGDYWCNVGKENGSPLAITASLVRPIVVPPPDLTPEETARLTAEWEAHYKGPLHAASMRWES